MQATLTGQDLQHSEGDSPDRSTLSIPELPSTASRIYGELNNATEIRLLYILPSKASCHPRSRTYQDLELQGFTSLGSAAIECQLKTTNRNTQIEYTALSYTWGEQHDNEWYNHGHFIQCNGISLRVTSNCLKALWLLRDTGFTGALWIDAICIDQNNVEERSAQVAQIGSVFSRAKDTVVVLFARESGLTAPAIPPPKLDCNPTGTPVLEERDDESCEVDIENNVTRTAVSPELFYHSPWFTRTWIVQEVMMSKRIEFLPEGSSRLIPWDVAMLAYAHWKEHFHLIGVPDVIELRQCERNYTNQTAQFQVGGTITVDDWSISQFRSYDPLARDGLGSIVELGFHELFNVLNRTRHFRCKDSRDKLFAILPFGTPFIRSLLQPDYSKSHLEVFRELTWLLLEAQCTEILSLACAPSKFWRPSWVVDWTDEAPQPWQLERLWHDTYCAGYWPRHHSLRIRRLSSSVVSIRGRIVGPVRRNSLPSRDNFGPPCVPIARKLSLVHTRQHTAEVGDMICVFLGFRTPFLLREAGDGFRIVDQCAVDGIMEGQAIAAIAPELAYEPEPCAGLRDLKIY